MGAFATIKTGVIAWADALSPAIARTYGTSAKLWDPDRQYFQRAVLEKIGAYLDTLGGGGPHTHPPSDVTGTAVVTNDSRLSDARTPLTHGHAASDVTGTAIVDNDARLSDARTPTTHDNTKHSATYVTAGDISTHAAVTASVHGSDESGKFPSTPTLCGLGNVSNAAQALASEKGAANGLATLSAASRVVQEPAWNAVGACPATTGAQTVPMDCRVKTLTPTGATTLNASGGSAGQEVTFRVLTSGTTSYTITFGTNFKKTGTLATGTTNARVFCVTFVFDGTWWCEMCRTATQT